MIDPGRAVCGVATVFGRRPVDFDRRPPEERHRVFQAADFRAFVDIGLGLPLMIEHQVVFTPHGLLPSIGTIKRLSIIEGHPTVPDCLLALGEVSVGEVGYSALQALDEGGWGMSVRAAEYWSSNAWVSGWSVLEVSLTRSPAIEGARVIGVGADAVRRWELLTGESILLATEVR
jgi:hypothetical protein